MKTEHTAYGVGGTHGDDRGARWEDDTAATTGDVPSATRTRGLG